jgi:hypothetical protein
VNVRRATRGVGVSGYRIGFLAFSRRSSLVSLNSTTRFGQGTTTFRPGIIRRKVFRFVFGSMNGGEIFS